MMLARTRPFASTTSSWRVRTTSETSAVEAALTRGSCETETAAQATLRRESAIRSPGVVFMGVNLGGMAHVILALFALFFSALPAYADDAYPSKPVRIVVPYPAGGVADLLPRIVGEKVSKKWGQPVIVDNKPGASGNIGMAEGARAAPDGYALVLAPTGNLTVNSTLFPNLGFDTRRDFAPVTLLAQSPNVLVVHPSVPAKNFRELIAYA